MTDLGSAMKGVILTETGTALPTPIRRETTPRGIGSERDQDALGEASSGAESAAERQRGPRRRSMAQSRPILPSSSTTSMIPRVPSSGSAQSTAESSSSASTAPRSAPVWDHEDEENLPSPFIKKNVDFSTYSRDRGISAASSTAPSRPASSLASKPRSSPTTATSIFSRAFKASGEAQKALARRQGEVKSGVS
ncbi:hypothetical protein DL93DRAFT_1723551 [Clavulina sp. PMI_390]|nr:hypothetical protein DL93DRAFT_1723551 [Clavulina sp. PMI_390]